MDGGSTGCGRVGLEMTGEFVKAVEGFDVVGAFGEIDHGEGGFHAVFVVVSKVVGLVGMLVKSYVSGAGAGAK